MEQMAEDAPAVQSAKAERPSVLAKLKAPLSQPCAEDKNQAQGQGGTIKNQRLRRRTDFVGAASLQLNERKDAPI